MNDNKRIAVNTIVLAIKMMVTIIVNLIASRLILQALGADDYGLYTVVGGIVSMLNILGTTMVSTSYRYLSVEIGKGENGNPNKVFNTLLIVHISLTLFFVVIGLSLGTFYVERYLNTDPSKISDALFVLYISMTSTAVSVVSVPYNGVIIAREKFTYTAALEIFDCLFKLGTVIWLVHAPGNRLRLFAIIMMVYSLILSLGYFGYCFVKEKPLLKWNFNRNWNDYKGVFSFAVWILVGAIAVISRIQGAALILNWFFGTLLNAAMGLATQVNTAVSAFVRSLTQATNPQIMKNIGGGNEGRSILLVYTISKFSYFIMLIPLIPLLLYVDEVLKIWLKTTPEYTSIFIVLFLISGLISSLHAGFDASIQATGKIKKNQIGFGIICLSLLPIIYVLYKIGCPPYTNGFVMVGISVTILFFQCYIMKEVTIFKTADYLKRTILPALYTTVVAAGPLALLRIIFGDSLWALLIFTVVSVIWTIIAIYILGLSSNEKTMLMNTKVAKKVVSKFKRN